jgi:hypothetical protein
MQEQEDSRIEEVCLKKNEIVLIVEMKERNEFSELPIRHHKYPEPNK